MKAQNFLAVAALAAIALTTVSCSNNDVPENNDPAVVKFSSGVTAAQSRVLIDGSDNSLWEAGDPVGIYMVDHGTAVIVKADARNVPFTAANSGPSTSFSALGPSIYYPLDETRKVDFIAYHPYNASLTDFGYPIDLSDQSSQSAIDLMWALADNSGSGYDKNDGRSNTTVNFTFDHQLVKLIFTAVNGTGVTALELAQLDEVRINGMNTSALFDLEGSGGITGESTQAPIIPFRQTGPFTYEAILLPVAGLGTDNTVTFGMQNGDIYTWLMYNDIPSLEAGKIYKYDITLNKHAVTATGSINSWTVGSTSTGVAE